MERPRRPVVPPSSACAARRALSEALDRLRLQEPEAVRLVELRFFAGLSIDEASETLGLGRTKTVKLWTYAKAWLFRELSD